MPTLHEQYRGYTIDQLLQSLEVVAGTGDPPLRYLENLLLYRTAETVNRQLAETARVAEGSANLIKGALDHATSTAKASIENSSEFLIAALKVNTETGARNAQEIKDQISGLTVNLAEASGKLQSAGNQSSRLGRNLNWLTAALVVAAILTAGASTFQAYETKRQADLADKQLHLQIQPEAPRQATSNTPRR